MARHGVDYDTVKQTVLKLLSKGLSPSVQKIREVLGTGSNSTIADHLKVWRAEHAAKKVHHLPATIPDELIATFEALWQTAMEHAEQHLADVKESIEAQEEKLNQEKTLTDRAIADLKSQLDQLNQKIEDKLRENQTLQTELAVANERFQKQSEEMDVLQQQHQLRLNYLHDEKNKVIDEANNSKVEIKKCKTDLLEQAESHKTTLLKERELQEGSEKRWAQMIDQARTETKNLQKKFDEAARKQAEKTEAFQNNLTKLQETITSTQTTLNHKNELIDAQSHQLEKIQKQYTSAISEIAVLKSKLETSTKKRNHQLTVA